MIDRDYVRFFFQKQKRHKINKQIDKLELLTFRIAIDQSLLLYVYPEMIELIKSLQFYSLNNKHQFVMQDGSVKL